MSFPLALISLHQCRGGLWGWDISSVIQQWGYLTGSSPSLPSLACDHGQDQWGEAAARTLGWASLLGQGCAEGFWWVWMAWQLSWEHSFAVGLHPQLRSRQGLKASPVYHPTIHLLWTRPAFLVPPSVGSIASSCPVLGFLRLGLKLEILYGTVELPISRMGLWRAREGDKCWLGHVREGLWCHLYPLLSL